MQQLDPIPFRKSDHGKLILLRVGDLRVDSSYQRDLNQVRVRRMAKVYDRDALGALEVSLRDDTYFVVDGNHRRALVIEVEGEDALVLCHVHEDWDQIREAQVFYCTLFINLTHPGAADSVSK